MTAAPFMQLYVGDYLADTMDLTTEQHGAYLLLLMTMWRHDARLPADPAKLARIARVSARRWHMVWSAIEGFFYTDEDGFIRNNRLDREHQKAVSISEKRSASGAAGGRAKALKDKEAGAANAMPSPQHSQKSDIREKEEPNGSSKKRASRLPADWRLPKAWGEWAIKEGLSEVCVRREADKFRDYWVAAPSAKAAKSDWQAVWRNWVRKAVDDLAAKSKPKAAAPQPGDWRTLPDGRRQCYLNHYDGWMDAA